MIAGPHYIELFNQISLHVCSLAPLSSSQPASKKRKIDEGLASRPANGANGYASNGTGAALASGNDPVLLEIKDISLVVPQRKKYTLCFTSSNLYARLPDSKEPVAGISYAWDDIGNSLDLSPPHVQKSLTGGYRICILPPRPRKDSKTTQLHSLLPYLQHNPFSTRSRSPSNPRAHRLHHPRHCPQTRHHQRPRSLHRIYRLR